MKAITDSLKIYRNYLGISQLELARRSQVSVPSIQNIEAGRGNPSIETLLRLLGALNLELGLTIKPANWKTLAYYGAPLLLSSTKKLSQNNEASSKQFVEVLRDACFELTYGSRGPDFDRKLESIEALLLALKGHYPKFFKKNCLPVPIIVKFVPLITTGRLIKLRRIAISRLAQFL